MPNPRESQAYWEGVLAAEGLEPLDSSRASRAFQSGVQKLASLTDTEKEGIALYYTACEEHLDWLKKTGRAWRVWALHCKGLGRREIAKRLDRSEKAVRTSLEKEHLRAGLQAPSWGGVKLLED